MNKEEQYLTKLETKQGYLTEKIERLSEEIDRYCELQGAIKNQLRRLRDYPDEQSTSQNETSPQIGLLSQIDREMIRISFLNEELEKINEFIYQNI